MPSTEPEHPQLALTVSTDRLGRTSTASAGSEKTGNRRHPTAGAGADTSSSSTPPFLPAHDPVGQAAAGSHRLSYFSHHQPKTVEPAPMETGSDHPSRLPTTPGHEDEDDQRTVFSPSSSGAGSVPPALQPNKKTAASADPNEPGTPADERSDRSNRSRRVSLRSVKTDRGCTFRPGDLRHLFTKEFAVGWAIVCTSLAVGAALVVYRKQIIPPVMSFAEFIRGLGYPGMLIIFALEFIASFPPMFGFGFFQLLAGFIYGMLGFVPIYIGGLLGGIICFVAARRWLGEHYRNLLKRRYREFAAIEAAIEEGGLQLVILLRLGPYPYAISNGVLSLTSVPLTHFTIATALCLLKALIQVYLGTTLQSIADLVMGNAGAGLSTLQIVMLVVGIVVAIAGVVYITWLIRRTLRRYEPRVEEEVDIEDGEADVERGGEADERSAGTSGGSSPVGGVGHSSSTTMLISRPQDAVARSRP
ncbi:Tlg2-vesicle protein [Phlyctochytrium bullatum]|nr:Tlg2-vesicle protein [Phlyctochytrium bullatum]